MDQEFPPHLVGEKGQKFGKYTLLTCLGNGGEAEVWKAIDTTTQEEVAVRILRKLKNTEDIRRHFDAEVQKLRQLARNDYIIPLWDYGWERELPYLVMPYIPGGSLASMLADLHSKGQQLPFKDAIRYIKQTLEALIYVHAHNIIHRDVKPSNLLRGSKGILLNDWGIALDAEMPDPLTRANIGTPLYSPPEQQAGQPVPASDQYAMAVTGCEILTGRRPKNGGLERLQALYPQIAEVFIRAWDSEHTKRFASMKDFADAFNNAALSDTLNRDVRDVFGGSTQPMLSGIYPPSSLVVPRLGSTPPRRFPQRWWLIIAAVLVIGASVGGVFALLHPTTLTTLCLVTNLPEQGAEAVSGQGVSRGVQLALSQSTNPFVTNYKGYRIIQNDLNDSSERLGGAPDPQVGVGNIQGLFPPSASCPNPIAIIGPSDSSLAVGEIPVAAENHILLLTPSSTAPCLTLASYSAPPDCIYSTIHLQGVEGIVNTFGRLPSTDINQGYIIANFLLDAAPKGLGAHRIVIVEDEEVYGAQIAQAAIDRLTQRGAAPLEVDCVKPVIEFTANPSCTFNTNANPFSLDMLAQLAAQVKNERPDAVFFAGLDDRGASLLRQQLGGSIPFIGADALIDEKSTFFGTLGSDSANIYATFPAPDPSTFSTSGISTEAAFYSQYQNMFNVPPEPYSANGYDAANIIIQAIKDMIDAGQQITPGNVAQAVLGNDGGKDFIGVTGNRIHFDQNGDNTNPQPYTIYQSKQSQPQGSWDWNPIATQPAV